MYPGRNSLYLQISRTQSCGDGIANSPNGSPWVMSRKTTVLLSYGSQIHLFCPSVRGIDMMTIGLECMLYPEGWYFKFIGCCFQVWALGMPLKSCSSFCFWQDVLTRTTFTFPSETNRNVRQNTWKNSFQDTDAKQQKKVVPERQETNMVSNMTPLTALRGFLVQGGGTGR